MNQTLRDLIEKARTLHSLDKQEIVSLLADDSISSQLFSAADQVRAENVGAAVHLRGLIEFSNICKQNCCYCGLRRDNRAIERYRLEPATIVDFAAKARTYGYKTIVLQSGEDDFYTVDGLQAIIREIKALNMAVTLSIGEKSRADYASYKEAGADRYLLRIETTDPVVYARLHPGMSLENRRRCLWDLKALGYEVGTGCLVGLPEQSLDSLADDILFFKELDADMIGLGPFIPNADTPLRGAAGGTFAASLKVMAITRLLLPDANIPATTAMETLDKNGRIIALQSGANVAMPNVTEGEYRRLYALYPGKICVNDAPAHCRSCITGKITGIGRPIAQDFGFRIKGGPAV